jgi:beta-glucosidase
MTDWISGIDVVAQMEAGNDLIMPGRPELFRALITAVKEGNLEESVLDRNISRILGIMMKTPRYKEYNYSGPDLESHAQIARKAASQGMVLLKNSEQALPLTQNDARVAAFGNTTYEIIIGGTGSGDVNEAYTVSLKEGLENAGFVPDADLVKTYLGYLEETRANQGPSRNPLAALMGVQEPLPEMPVTKSQAQQAAASSDVALITVGRIAGEGGDRQAVEGDFYLTEVEKEMISNVSEAFHAAGKKAIVILNIAGVVETASWRDIPDAILCAWHPGQEAGNAIMDVVSGKVNPSGKLSSTFPLSYEDAPTAKNFPGTVIEEEGQPESPSGPSVYEVKSMEVLYEEDIYVGYRYYNTFDIPVAYEFGYGLSYTGFEYSNLAIENPDFNGTLNFSVEVKNSGDLAGKETVQVYISAPGKDMDKPAQELVAFGKTHLLQPGESQTLEFVITTADIASFDEENSSWAAEAGEYALKVGTSSLDIRQAGTFSLLKAMNAGTVSRSLLPEKEINRIYAN